MGIVMSVWQSLVGNRIAAWRRHTLGMKRFNSAMEIRIEKILQERAAKNPSKVRSLNALLMKLGSIHEGLEECRAAFDSIDLDHNGALSYEELKAGAQTLGFDGNDEDLEEVFKYSDIDGKNVLSFREFLVTTLNLFLLEESSRERQLSPEVRQAFNAVIDSFLYFDVEGTGYLDKNEVLQASYEAKEGLPESMVGRFQEMDADGSGHVTIAEFLYTLSEWAGVDDEAGEAEAATNTITDLKEQLRAASFNMKSTSPDSSRHGRDSRRVSFVREKTDSEVAKALSERASSTTSTVKSADALLMKLAILRTGFKDIFAAFYQADTNLDGALQHSELRLALEALGCEVHDEDFERLKKYPSVEDENHEVHYSQFCSFLVHLALLVPASAANLSSNVQKCVDVLLDAFTYFDKSGEGVLDLPELVQGFSSGDGSSANLIRARFEEMDWDNSGTITLGEFVNALRQWAIANDDYDDTQI